MYKSCGLAIFAILSAVIGYFWYSHRFPSWKEEVVLADGRKIIVKQRRDYIEGYGTRKTWLTFSLPEMGGEQTWSESMSPVLIAVTPAHEVYVAGWPSGFNQSKMYNLPKYGYVAYKWNGSAFLRVPFLEIPREYRQETNILRCFPRLAYIEWENKMEFGCDSKGHFSPNISREIDLEKMKSWAIRNAKLNNVLPKSE